MRMFYTFNGMNFLYLALFSLTFSIAECWFFGRTPCEDHGSCKKCLDSKINDMKLKMLLKIYFRNRIQFRGKG